MNDMNLHPVEFLLFAIAFVFLISALLGFRDWPVFLFWLNVMNAGYCLGRSVAILKNQSLR